MNQSHAEMLVTNIRTILEGRVVLVQGRVQYPPLRTDIQGN